MPTDRDWMTQALALAAVAEGATSPNPRVGCLVVANGEVIGAGYHRGPGTPHAEQAAVDQALSLQPDRIRGATLYVTLEPCVHHGRTPPCVERVLDSGVARVVAAMQDPNPIVDGRGFEALRAAGVEVEVGLLGDESRRLNDAFFHWHRTGRPLVTLKAAISLDGMLAARGGRSRWITGELARRFAHRLRLRHDAVLVGGGTARTDRPRLDVRLPGINAARQPVVLSRTLELDPGAPPFIGATRALVYTAPEVAAANAELWCDRAELVGVEPLEDLDEMLADLGRRGVQALLVEGGAETHASFLRHGAVDRVALFQSARLIGSAGATPLLRMDAVDEPARSFRVLADRRIPLGDDLLWLGRLIGPGEGEHVHGTD